MLCGEAAAGSPDFILTEACCGGDENVRVDEVTTKIWWRNCVPIFYQRQYLIASGREMEGIGFLGTKILSWQVWCYGNEANNFFPFISNRSTVNIKFSPEVKLHV